LITTYDNTNSLHTNAYDEAITPPTEESVLGAMETGYQRGKIQEESLCYEHKKHDGSYPIIGVNTFRNPHGDPVPEHLELIRSSDEEKQSQLKRLRDAVIRNENVFAVLMDAVRVCSLGQITHALFEVGGQCRRST
jgi:methylmalonyl-CoA mutase